MRLIQRLDHNMLTLDKDMKLTRVRRASQDSQPVTTRRRASQDNKRKFSAEGTAAAEQRAKKQQTSSTDSHEEMSSTSDDDESDNYTDSDAGDIPYDGLPRRIVSHVFLRLTRIGLICIAASQSDPKAPRSQQEDNGLEGSGAQEEGENCCFSSNRASGHAESNC